MLRPTQGAAFILPWVIALFVVLQAVFLLSQIGLFIEFYLVWWIIFIPYAARKWLRDWAMWHYRQPAVFRKVDDEALKRLTRWLAVGALCLLTGIPGYIPFYLSLPWLNKAAEYEYAEVPMGALPTFHWALLYPMNVVGRSPRGLDIVVGGGWAEYLPDDSSYPLEHWLCGHWFGIGDRDLLDFFWPRLH